MEEVKKKKLPIIIAIITFIALITGATYAYFAVGTTNNFGTSTINATADNLGSVALNGSGTNLIMNLSASDMSPSNAGYYYASSNGRTNTPTEEVIAVATVSPNDDTHFYSCTYKLNITHTGTNDMYDVFNHQTNGEYDYEGRNGDQIILVINGTTYDWASNAGMPSEVSGNFHIAAGETVELTAGLTLTNNANLDQSALAGTDININITVATNSFECTVINEPETNYYVLNSEKESDYTDLRLWVLEYTNNDNNYIEHVGYPDQTTCQSDLTNYTVSQNASCSEITPNAFVKETEYEIIAQTDLYEYIESDGNMEFSYGVRTAAEYQNLGLNIVNDYIADFDLSCPGQVEDNDVVYKCAKYAEGQRYNVKDSEVCGIFANNTLDCFSKRSWGNITNIKSTLEGRGASCTYLIHMGGMENPETDNPGYAMAMSCLKTNSTNLINMRYDRYTQVGDESQGVICYSQFGAANCVVQ